MRTPAPPRGRQGPSAQPSEQGERLSKRLSELKLASRREADEWIEAGWVKVDGKMAVLGQRVGPDACIEIDPAARQQQAERVTILLNKPIGYVSGQAEDGYEPAVVLVTPENHWTGDPSKLQPHPGQRRGLAPAGRLDIDSTGLLVLTQDGRIAKALIGDDSDVEKEYLVRVEYIGRPGQPPAPEGLLPSQLLAPEDLALLNHGLWLDDQPLRPARVSWQNEQQLRVVLREGRKRQIRRMCEQVGLKVVGLKRVRIGRIPLGQLPLGQWRYLSPWESF
jgi:23S rRNA pseudouridine2604 synthase